LADLPRIARSQVTVLILGETGTGKELMARAVHYLSPRSDKAFVPVNCGALPNELVENELFGHVAGAYTGAGNSSDGLIREADAGTLFLDEVDSLPPPAQAKLLRFLQEKEIRPVGARKSRKVDARVVAAANTDLREAVRARQFRADLFYRLNVVPLLLAPLRDRREDIPELAEHFAQKYAHQFSRPTPVISSAARQKLLTHSWWGNIRELENVVERAVLLAKDDRLEPEDFVLEGGREAAATDFKTL
jgi:transcriptional regulator with GAF, ATPase, and Fis domain